MRYTLLFYLFLSLVCCEPDDICSQSTQTTPRLIIDFYDIENLSDKKSVAGLFAIGINEQGDEINIIGESVETRDRIELPLDGNNSESNFKLYKNYNIIDGIIQGNPDIISINYNTESVYVSRACGYKNNYSINDLNIDNDIDLWIVFSEVIINQVENENVAHVQIFH